MKILVVDDSIVYRSSISKALNSLEFVTSVQVASNGEIALDFLRSQKFDAVTLDMEMPKMDGLTTLEEIRKTHASLPVIMLASPVANQAEKTLSALEKGAQDFVEKVQSAQGVEQSVEQIKNEIGPLLKAYVEKPVTPTVDKEKKRRNDDGLLQSIFEKKYDASALIIGSSTGGPDLWRQVFKELGSSASLRMPVFLVQHMPPVFTKKFAQVLDKLVGFRVVEAQDQMKVEPNTFYVAPGDYHMCLYTKGQQTRISLNQNEKECYVRPSVNYLFNSALKAYPEKLLALVLTGMGEDGLKASRLLHEAKVPIIIQDSESSSVWGMPGAIAKEKLQSVEISSKELVKLMQGFSI